MADDAENYHEEDHKELIYLNLMVADYGTDVGITRVFEKAFMFLEEAQEARQKVLIHCVGGRNRSGNFFKDQSIRCFLFSPVSLIMYTHTRMLLSHTLSIIIITIVYNSNYNNWVVNVVKEMEFKICLELCFGEKT